jgi:hypothetical protein
LFGNVTINRDELKGKDLDTYNHFYCGLCQDLKTSCGQFARATLTYDMTFLAILLTALYEKEPTEEVHRCGMHGGAKRTCLRNEYTAYAAEMNVLLVYHNLMDDWIDDRSVKSRAAAGILRKACDRTAERYPEKIRAIEDYLKNLHEVEQSGSSDLDLASGLTGKLMREIYVIREDHWSRDLGEVGFYMGKYIYLRDAYDDIRDDLEKGNYNPFASMSEQEDFDERAKEVLRMMAGSAARAFERLPIVEYLDILRNILYSGIWVRKPEKKRRRGNKEENPQRSEKK